MKFIILFILPLFCFSQNDNYDLLKKLPKAEFQNAVNDSIVKLNSSDLWNFIYAIKDGNAHNLEPFNNSFVEKLKTTKSPMETHFLTVILLEQNTNKIIVENILNQKKNIWDNGQWSGKIWKLIRENNLTIDEDKNYKIDKKGEKNYDLNLYLQEKITNNQIGSNPMLTIDYNITPYPENKLLETLSKLNIKDIQIIIKDKSPSIFGYAGRDGVIQVLTRK